MSTPDLKQTLVQVNQARHYKMCLSGGDLTQLVKEKTAVEQKALSFPSKGALPAHI